MATLATYELDVADLLHDPNQQFWSIAQLDRYINQARTQLVMDTGCLRTLQTAYFTQAQEQYTFGQVTGAMITAGGSGYVAPTVSFFGGGGSGVAATLGVSSGAVTSINFTSFGSGYSSAPTPTFANNPGAVSTIAVVTPGVGYTSLPAIGFSGGGGAGAAASAHLGLPNFGFAVGTGYAVGDVITGAAGTFTRPVKLVVSAIGGGGSVSSIQFIDIGDYSVLPGAGSATTTNGAGTGFTITPTSWVLTSVVVTAGGSGYTSAPTATVTGGGGTVQGTLSTTVIGVGVSASIAVGVINVNTYDVLDIYIFWGGSRRRLRWRPFSTFANEVRQWIGLQRTPVMWAVYGENQVFIGPLPDQTYQAEFDTVILPTALAGSDVDPIPAMAQVAIPYYAARLAKLNDQAFGEAEAFFAQYQRRLNDIGSAYTRRMPSNN